MQRVLVLTVLVRTLYDIALYVNGVTFDYVDGYVRLVCFIRFQLFILLESQHTCNSCLLYTSRCV